MITAESLMKNRIEFLNSFYNNPLGVISMWSIFLMLMFGMIGALKEHSN
jgi:hypothetical protein